MADSTLQAIRTKVRRLVRSPSPVQLLDIQIDEYINTFIVFDFPEHLRLFSLHTTFTFMTNPYQDVYPTDTVSFGGNTTNPLYDFKNRYITVNPPVYIAGYQQLFTQSRNQFFSIYPKINSIQRTGLTGNGVQTTFTGVVSPGFSPFPLNNQISAGLLQNEVTFTSVTNTVMGLSMVDVPVVDPVTGYKTVNGNLYVPGSLPATPPTVIDPTNTINYATGAFTVTFPQAPGNSAPITAQVVPTTIAIPQALLYYDDTFVVRPVPNQAYRVQFEAFIRPTELLAVNSHPQLNQWWQYIAYGAAKKIFEDRMDLESTALIMPEFKKQESLVLRRTIVQQTNERVATIYTEQTNLGSGFGGFGWGGGFW